ncbi:molybdopterin-dependent oxidoreductase [Ammoniphilus sp. YIM 78166]|uniref:molybdopterin-dependent oxidoreductase n=1 Tax=Ammoniphilus sp. YIM 78166 TaxID=1644106 RepID=UPI00106F25B6|nr:molybdopterin-dependent oxidoreductase [Ammoniphilus sp. YIM 78166]
MEWKITIIDLEQQNYTLSFEQMEAWKNSAIPVEDVVPGKQAEAVYLAKIFNELQISTDFVQAKVEAADGFVQQVESADLTTAFLVFKQKGEALAKGFPARLFVPSAADCLNVKSVVQIQLLGAC